MTTGRMELPGRSGAARRRGDGAHGQVLSEVVIAIATLSQEKAWRWRLLDIESDQPQALPRCLESDSVSTSEADTLVGMYLRRPGREFSTVRLVASLIPLLRAPLTRREHETPACRWKHAVM